MGMVMMVVEVAAVVVRVVVGLKVLVAEAPSIMAAVLEWGVSNVGSCDNGSYSGSSDYDSGNSSGDGGSVAYGSIGGSGLG